jgi:hypothetical protein
MKRSYFRCPACHRKRVTLRLRSHGEDNYQCDRCGWYVFADEVLGDEPVELALTGERGHRPPQTTTGRRVVGSSSRTTTALIAPSLTVVTSSHAPLPGVSEEPAEEAHCPER